MTNPKFSWKIFKFQVWPRPHPHWKIWISDLAWTWKDDWPPSPLKILNFKFGLDMVRWLTPILTKNFKFQIWPGHGKMTNTKLSLKIFKFQIWPGHGEMTDTTTPTESFKFQTVSGHGKMPYPQPSLKFLNLKFCLDMEKWLTPHTSLKILNFGFSLGMDRWPILPTFTEKYKFQILHGQRKMIWPPNPHCKFLISDWDWTW